MTYPIVIFPNFIETLFNNGALADLPTAIEHELKRILQSCEPPITYDRKTERKGIGEDVFYKYLIESFERSEFIFDNLTIRNTLYQPDIVVYLNEVNFIIDIEIDEPYSAEGEPIHYLESENDKERDKFFNKNGWLVIRFSEFQVIKFPEDCMKFIGLTINQVLNRFSMDMELGNLKAYPRWSEFESKKMAYLNFRNTYLSNRINPMQELLPLFLKFNLNDCQ